MTRKKRSASYDCCKRKHAGPDHGESGHLHREQPGGAAGSHFATAAVVLPSFLIILLLMAILKNALRNETANPRITVIRTAAVIRCHFPLGVSPSDIIMLAELSGRSYEYYSEDGVLSGMPASRYGRQISDAAVRAGRNGRPLCQHP